MSDTTRDPISDSAAGPPAEASPRPPLHGRRFNDDEVAEILTRATRPVRGGGHPGGPDDPRLPGEAGGLTLVELQSIGAEVGIAPQRIASAARELQLHAATPAPHRFLGAPSSVSHIVPLAGPLDDAAWDRLVAHLRSTFEAQGKISQSGAIRSWRNGNLQAHVEPDPDAAAAGMGIGPSAPAWRLRMQTRKGSASAAGNFGAFAIVFGFVMMIIAAFADVGTQALIVGAAFSLGGLLQVGYLRATLPGWAQMRKAQMEQIAAGVTELKS